MWGIFGLVYCCEFEADAYFLIGLMFLMLLEVAELLLCVNFVRIIDISCLLGPALLPA